MKCEDSGSIFSYPASQKILNGQPSFAKKERRNNELNLGTHARQHRVTRENPNVACPQAIVPDVKNVLIANIDQKVATAVRNIIHTLLD